MQNLEEDSNRHGSHELRLQRFQTRPNKLFQQHVAKVAKGNIQPQKAEVSTRDVRNQRLHEANTRHTLSHSKILCSQIPGLSRVTTPLESASLWARLKARTTEFEVTWDKRPPTEPQTARTSL